MTFTCFVVSFNFWRFTTKIGNLYLTSPLEGDTNFCPDTIATYILFVSINLPVVIKFSHYHMHITRQVVLYTITFRTFLDLIEFVKHKIISPSGTFRYVRFAGLSFCPLFFRGDWKQIRSENQNGVLGERSGEARTATKRWLSSHRIRQKSTEEGPVWFGIVYRWSCRNGLRILSCYHRKQKTMVCTLLTVCGFYIDFFCFSSL